MAYIERVDDLVGPIRAPKEITDYLARVGGKNPFGEPVYRLVYAQSRMTRQGGLWQVWPDGSKLSDRGGMEFQDGDRLLPNQYRPISQKAELKQIQKYADVEGWLVERWFPAHLYGGREEWYRHKVPGYDIPLLGPYPEKGDYEAITDAATYVPSFTEMREAIQKWESARENVVGTAASRAIARTNELEWQQQEAERKFEEFATKFLDDFSKPIWGSSLAAGRMRTELAERAGIREHAGA